MRQIQETKSLQELVRGINDMVEGHRLREDMIPDDWIWLNDTLSSIENTKALPSPVMALVVIREDVSAGHMGQDHTLRGTYYLNDRSVRVHIRYDSSHPSQSGATGELWADRWNNVVSLIGSQIPRYCQGGRDKITAGLHTLRDHILDEMQDVMGGR